MLLPEPYLEDERPLLFLINATPTVQTIMVVKITMKAISGKTCESGTPDVKGNEANTAAAKPLGNIMVMSLSYSCSSDFTAAILTTMNRIPRKTKDRNRPKKTDAKDERLNRRPVKTKKKDRIRKLI